MIQIVELESERLKLRQWIKDDWPDFARLCADPLVMKHFPAILSQNESIKMADAVSALISERGWGFWAVEEKSSGRFIGFVGLHVPQPALPCSPCVEIGWRLAKEYWGKGYATEAGKVALKFAFEELQLAEVVSFTAVENLKSRAVMERLQMLNTHQNFEHPSIPVGHKLREHILFKITRGQWETSAV
jgi:RimJ/RimL family protein N-acetyltransferase